MLKLKTRKENVVATLKVKWASRDSLGKVKLSVG